MATLTADQLAEIRRSVSASLVTVNYTKPLINAALQAIEDWYEANKTVASTAVDTATSPFIFTNPQKKKIFCYWLFQKFKLEVI